MPADSNPVHRSGAELIASERARQISVEGWTPEHDDDHDGYELSAAARCYTMAAEATEYDTNCVTFDRFRPGERPPKDWPWPPSWWKPSTSAIRNLVKAGALIAAEIDRLQRDVDRTPTTCDCEHPHPEHPCGREVVDGVTLCPYCGHLDGSKECNCWTPATQAHLDSILCEVMERASGMTVGAESLLRVYVASKSEHGDAWKTWRAPLADMGVEIISTWIDESGPGESVDMADLWVRCVSEASSCDLLVAVHHIGETWKGAFVEIGAALAHGHPVYVIGNPPGSWINHPLVTLAESIEHAIEDYRFRRSATSSKIPPDEDLA